MSEVKVNKISPRTACGTVTLGDSGDTFTIPSGATITNAGTASGFGATGEISWDTTVKTTGTFTATAGVGYFLNTTGGIITVNLPVGAAGSSVALADYAGTWQTNNVTVAANGTEKIGGIDADVTLSTEGQSVTFVYIDGTQGWVNVLDSTSNVRGATFIVATGGSVPAGTTTGNYKYHTFTGPGTFCVSAIGTTPACNVVDYMIAAGGGAGGTGNPASSEGGGGGGAGGWRASAGTGSGSYTAGPSPLTAPVSPVPVSVTPYSIVVGGGGASGSTGSCVVGADGNVSSGFSITSAGGGGGGSRSYTTPDTGRAAGNSGGSGGGAAYSGPAGATAAIGIGNTPPESPAQGTSGGLRVAEGGGGGGGAVSIGLAPAAGPIGGVGGTGATSCITASPVGYSGGGGGGAPTTGGPATQGGGTGGNACATAPSGTVNTGGGGGGGRGTQSSGAGGSGVVIIRYRFQ